MCPNHWKCHTPKQWSWTKHSCSRNNSHRRLHPHPFCHHCQAVWVSMDEAVILKTWSCTMYESFAAYTNRKSQSVLHHIFTCLIFYFLLLVMKYRLLILNRKYILPTSDHTRSRVAYITRTCVFVWYICLWKWKLIFWCKENKS